MASAKVAFDTVRLISGKEKQHKHKLFGPDFPRTFLTLTPGCPAAKKFLPTTGAAGKRTFWCGRPRFSARTSMTRRVVEKLCTKKVCVDFFAPNVREGVHREKLTVKKLISITRCFFTVCVPYKPWKTLRKPWKIGTQKATIFSQLVCHRFCPHEMWGRAMQTTKLRKHFQRLRGDFQDCPPRLVGDFSGTLWESEMVGKQRYGNRPPIDDRNPIRKISIDCLDASKSNDFFRGRPRRDANFTFPRDPNPFFKALKAPYLTLRVATPSGAPRQAPLDQNQRANAHLMQHLYGANLVALLCLAKRNSALLREKLKGNN